MWFRFELDLNHEINHLNLVKENKYCHGVYKQIYKCNVESAGISNNEGYQTTTTNCILDHYFSVSLLLFHERTVFVFFVFTSYKHNVRVIVWDILKTLLRGSM